MHSYHKYAVEYRNTHEQKKLNEGQKGKMTEVHTTHEMSQILIFVPANIAKICLSGVRTQSKTLK